MKVELRIMVHNKDFVELSARAQAFVQDTSYLAQARNQTSIHARRKLSGGSVLDLAELDAEAQAFLQNLMAGGGSAKEGFLQNLTYYGLVEEVPRQLAKQIQDWLMKKTWKRGTVLKDSITSVPVQLQESSRILSIEAVEVAALQQLSTAPGPDEVEPDEVVVYELVFEIDYGPGVYESYHFTRSRPASLPFLTLRRASKALHTLTRRAHSPSSPHWKFLCFCPHFSFFHTKGNGCRVFRVFFPPLFACCGIRVGGLFTRIHEYERHASEVGRLSSQSPGRFLRPAVRFPILRKLVVSLSRFR